MSAAAGPSAEVLALEMRRHVLAQRGLYFLAAVILAFSFVDGISVGRVPWESVAVRVLWAATVVGLARSLPGASPQGFSKVIGRLALVSVAAMTFIALVTGGSHSPVFEALPITALVALIFTQDEGSMIAWVAMGSGAAVAAILLVERQPAVVLARDVGYAAVMGVLAVQGARLFKRRRAAEAASDQARIDALEQLGQSERRRATAERLATIGQLAAGVAHEINNPLSYVKSNFEFLCDELGSARDGELSEVLGETRQGLQRIEQIVRDLRSFARAGDHEVDAVELRAVCEEALRLASGKLKNLCEPTLDVAQELPRLETSRGRLLQILVNLLVNAVDALESAPDRPARPSITLRAEQSALGVTLAIEDNGPGIAPDALPRLFEPFFTTKPPGKGTGLGLSLSREYARALGGELRAENLPAGGARFALELPLQCRRAPGEVDTQV